VLNQATGDSRPYSRPLLLSLLVIGGSALLPLSPARAEARSADGAETRLDRPGCRTALGISSNAPAPQLLRADPTLAARLASTPACLAPPGISERLQQLEQELEASRQRIAAETARQDGLARDLAQLRSELKGEPIAPAVAASTAADKAQPAPDPIHYTPGKGFTLQANGATLRLMAEAKLLGFSSSRYVFNPGQPLVVSPKDPDASYDLSAQQSTVTAAFQGPKWGNWTPGAFALFTLQDNLLAEGYSFTPVVFYGEIADGHWRIAAGQNFDVFAPRDPDNVTTGKLASSGNPGAYRPQFRVERSLGQGPDFGGLLQLAVSSPITTALPSNLDLANLQTEDIVEDNGWPNLEARLNFGFGAVSERAGGRRLRPLELGVSGVIGQLRVLDNIRPTDPITLAADRSTVDVWGAALDGQLALGRRFGINGELYTGQGLGEYMAGIFQSYNRSSNQAVPTAGGWGQFYVYLADNLRLNLGYGIDHAQDSGTFGLQVNSTAFANVIWDVNPWLQLGLEGNYKLSTYDAFGDKDAWVVISEVMFRL
jgi:hypothetical protein